MPLRKPEPTRAEPSTTDPTDPEEDAGTKYDRFTDLLTRVIRAPRASRNPGKRDDTGATRER